MRMMSAAASYPTSPDVAAEFPRPGARIKTSTRFRSPVSAFRFVDAGDAEGVSLRERRRAPAGAWIETQTVVGFGLWSLGRALTCARGLKPSCRRWRCPPTHVAPHAAMRKMFRFASGIDAEGARRSPLPNQPKRSRRIPRPGARGLKRPLGSGQPPQRSVSRTAAMRKVLRFAGGDGAEGFALRAVLARRVFRFTGGSDVEGVSFRRRQRCGRCFAPRAAAARKVFHFADGDGADDVRSPLPKQPRRSRRISTPWRAD